MTTSNTDGIFRFYATFKMTTSNIEEIFRFYDQLDRFVDHHNSDLVFHRMKYQNHSDDGFTWLAETFRQPLIQYLTHFDRLTAEMYVSIMDDTYLPFIESVYADLGRDDPICIFGELWETLIQKAIIKNNLVMIKVLILLVQNRYAISYPYIYYAILSDPEILRLLWHSMYKCKGDPGYQYHFERSLLIGMSMNRTDIIDLYTAEYDKKYLIQATNDYRYIMGQTDEIPNHPQEWVDLKWLQKMRHNRIKRNICNHKYIQVITNKLTKHLPDDCINEIVKYLKSSDRLLCPKRVYQCIRKISMLS